MNQNQISSDDPRLTTYALDEMEPAERAEFEQALAHDADAQRAVEEIRSATRELSLALEDEPLPTVVAAEPKLNRDFNRKIIRFPYWIVGTAAAACFAVVFTYTQFEHANQPVIIQPTTLEKQSGNRAGTQTAGAGDTQIIEVKLEPLVSAKTATVAETAARPVEPVTGNEIAAGSRRRTPQAGDVVVLDKVEVTEKSLSSGMVESAPPIMPVPQPQPPMLAQTGGGLSASAVFGQIGGTGPSPQGSAVAYDVAAVGGAAGGGSYNDEAIKLEAFRVMSGSQARQEMRAARTRHMGLQSNDFFRAATPEREMNTEAYAHVKDNDFKRAVGDDALSTFSIDADTAAYANMRRFLTGGQRPPRDAVRIEELVNYFPYRYEGPKDRAPFAASMEVASAPWKPEHRLVRIGLKGREVTDASRPAANLVFLLDVSGSMNHPNKLPLVKQSLRMLVDKLRNDDRVAIVVYAGAAGLALPSTSARQKAEILRAIDELNPGGSTNGAAGIQLAYDIAKANLVGGGVNRVILATDGDFNVGTTSEGELTRLIEEKAKSGVFLTVLGFGMGNYKDATLEQLADKGSGNYAYIDTEREVRKALVEQAGGTLVTIAKDVKIQVEFNPAEVQAYRLIGYENRMLAKEDFNNDKVDAGEIGAGHTVTALYEVVPHGVPMPEMGKVDPLKYQRPANPVLINRAELLTLKVRYKEPAGDVSTKLEFPLRDDGRLFADASVDFKFAAAVASFGMILRESPHKGAAKVADVVAWAQAGTGEDEGGHRGEFIGLVKQSESLLAEE